MSAQGPLPRPSSTPDPSAWHDTHQRVRYSEVDRMGYLWHGHHLALFEEARTDWLRVRGLSYRALEDSGTLLVVVETGVRYLRPAAFEDQLVVRCRLVEASGVRLKFDYEILREGKRLVTGFSLLAAVDRRGRPQRLPQALVDLMEPAPSPESGTVSSSEAVQGPGPEGRS